MPHTLEAMKEKTDKSNYFFEQAGKKTFNQIRNLEIIYDTYYRKGDNFCNI